MVNTGFLFWAAQVMKKHKEILQQLLGEAEVAIDGHSPHDIRVRDPQVYDRVLAKWSLGLGEAFMDGQWECERLDEMLYRLMRAGLDHKVRGWGRLRLAFASLKARLVNLQSRRRAFQVGEQHYDIGNDVFEAMLDEQMIYSCAYWQHAKTLGEAQQHKLEMICRKLELKPGERLLEIGCGWGGFAAHAARHHGVEVVGITVSREQQKLAQETCRGLAVEIQLIDYRDLEGKFDKAVSVGMFEHVGYKNYRDYFKTVHRLLADDGLFLLHTIGNRVTSRKTDPWINKYIFPNGKIPSAKDIAETLEELFIVEDWHNFGQDYDRTLMAWHDNFEAAWPKLSEKYDERFRRMWLFYLSSSAGYFRSRQGQLWQIVLSKQARQDTYRSWRASAT